jgi:hypothetical protein
MYSVTLRQVPRTMAHIVQRDPHAVCGRSVCALWHALQAGTVEERKRLLKQFAQEREAAKRRLMSVGAALQQQALGNSISRGGSPGRPRSASAARQGSPGGSSKAPAAAQPAGSSAREGC